MGRRLPCRTELLSPGFGGYRKSQAELPVKRFALRGDGACSPASGAGWGRHRLTAAGRINGAVLNPRDGQSAAVYIIGADRSVIRVGADGSQLEVVGGSGDGPSAGMPPTLAFTHGGRYATLCDGHTLRVYQPPTPAGGSWAEQYCVLLDTEVLSSSAAVDGAAAATGEVGASIILAAVEPRESELHILIEWFPPCGGVALAVLELGTATTSKKLQLSRTRHVSTRELPDCAWLDPATGADGAAAAALVYISDTDLDGVSSSDSDVPVIKALPEADGGRDAGRCLGESSLPLLPSGYDFPEVEDCDMSRDDRGPSVLLRYIFRSDGGDTGDESSLSRGGNGVQCTHRIFIDQQAVICGVPGVDLLVKDGVDALLYATGASVCDSGSNVFTRDDGNDRVPIVDETLIVAHRASLHGLAYIEASKTNRKFMAYDRTGSVCALCECSGYVRSASLSSARPPPFTVMFSSIRSFRRLNALRWAPRK